MSEHPYVSSRSAGATASKLPDAELDVLACLWQRGQATARQIREMMESYRPMAHGSTVTLLKRLEGKGLVSRKKGPVGKAFIYRPTQSAKPARRRLLRDMAQRIFGGNGVAMVSALLDSEPPTAEELDQLEQLIEQLRARNQTGGEGS